MIEEVENRERYMNRHQFFTPPLQYRPYLQEGTSRSGINSVDSSDLFLTITSKERIG